MFVLCLVLESSCLYQYTQNTKHQAFVFGVPDSSPDRLFSAFTFITYSTSIFNDFNYNVIIINRLSVVIIKKT